MWRRKKKMDNESEVDCEMIVGGEQESQRGGGEKKDGRILTISV